MIMGPAFEHAFDLHLDFHSRLRFPLEGGSEFGFVGVAGGTVEGPLLSGKVMPNSGGDYAHIRPDGTVEFNAHYLLEAQDGTVIYLYNRGYGNRNREAYMLEQDEQTNQVKTVASAYYFRVTPSFKAPPGPYDWLNRNVVIGVAERHFEPDHTVFRYYLVK